MWASVGLERREVPVDVGDHGHPLVVGNGVAQHSWATCGLKPGSRLVEELEYAVPDVVAQAASLPAGHEGRVGHVPVLVALAFDDRACVAAAHRDDDIGQADHLRAERLGELPSRA